MSIKGMKRVQVVSVQMVKEKNTYYENTIVNSPRAGEEIIRQFIGNSDREMFVVGCLDTKNKVTNITVVSMGSLNASIVHPREVFKTAILSNAAKIICGHNHPSGDSTPSKEDIEVTKRLKEAGKLLGIDLLDHLVIGDNNYTSLAEQGYC